MTAAYLKASSRTLPNGVVLVVALTLCQFGTGICEWYSFAISQHVRVSLCCIKVGWFKVGGSCKLGEHNVSLLMYILLAR